MTTKNDVFWQAVMAGSKPLPAQLQTDAEAAIIALEAQGGMPQSLHPAVAESLTLICGSPRSHGDCLARVLSLFDAIAGRVGYLQLLADSEQTLQNLITLIAQSPWLANFVRNHSMVFDELLDIEQEARWQRWHRISQRLRQNSSITRRLIWVRP